MMRALKAAIELFESWNDNGVIYCHWKSNEHLLEGLAGETDLDILCDIQQKRLCREILINKNYIRLKPQFGSRYPDVEDWVSCDEDTGKMIHIHLHFQMITGHQGLKEYLLPWTELALNTRILNPYYHVYTIEPALELMILFSRIGLKATNSKIYMAKKKCFKLPYEDYKEIRYLLEKADFAELKQLVERYFPKSSADMCQVLESDEYDGNWYVKLYNCCIRDLEKYSRLSVLPKQICRLFYYLLIRMRFYINRHIKEIFILKKSLGHKRGVVIAFIGQDGAGKSTISEEVKAWLEWKLDVRKYYLGSGDHYYSLQKSLSYLFKCGKFDLLGKAFSILDLKNLSRHVRKSTIKAFAYSEKGGIAVFDRYPQLMVYGINDGPKIRKALANKKMSCLLSEILYHYAITEEANYKKAIEIEPDLVIKLILPPEVSVQRKPEESLESVTIKNNIIKRMRFKNSKVITIDATMDYSEELRIIHNEIWKCIRKKQNKE